MEQKCYIISYELGRQRAVNNFITAIKSYGNWARINSSTWAVVTSSSAVEVRNNLDHHLEAGDRIFVIKSAIESAWRNTECSSEWLKNNL